MLSWEQGVRKKAWSGRERKALLGPSSFGPYFVCSAGAQNQDLVVGGPVFSVGVAL